MVELSPRRRENRGDGWNDREKMELREFPVQINWPSPIRQVQIPIRRVISPIQGLLNPIRDVILLISHCHSYPPYRSHLHHPSLIVLSTTLPSLQEHKVQSSLSISHCHHHELTLSATYTEYSIHRVQHTPKIVCRPIILMVSSWLLTAASASGVPPHWSTAASQSSIRASLPIDHHQPVLHKCFTGKVTSSHPHGFELSNQWIEFQHLARLPSTTSRLTTSKYSSNLAQS